jgi:SYF2 splicing factor
VPSLQQQQLAAENLYRDANSLIYADNKPTEDAIDRVVSKINREFVHIAASRRTGANVICAALTRKANSPASGLTKMKATLPISTSTTEFSTKRSVGLSICIMRGLIIPGLSRLQGIMTSIRQRLERALSEALLYELVQAVQLIPISWRSTSWRRGRISI